jgi:hypothetical protein
VGFFGIGSTLIDAHTLPGQTEGLKVCCGGMGGRRDGCQYMYCLPPAGVLHSQNKVINAP